MGFLSKLKYKVEDKATDKIVDKMFGRKEKEAELQANLEEQQAMTAQSAAVEQPDLLPLKSSRPSHRHRRCPPNPCRRRWVWRTTRRDALNVRRYA